MYYNNTNLSRCYIITSAKVSPYYWMEISVGFGWFTLCCWYTFFHLCVWTYLMGQWKVKELHHEYKSLTFSRQSYWATHLSFKLCNFLCHSCTWNLCCKYNQVMSIWQPDLVLLWGRCELKCKSHFSAQTDITWEKKSSNMTYSQTVF